MGLTLNPCKIFCTNFLGCHPNFSTPEWSLFQIMHDYYAKVVLGYSKTRPLFWCLLLHYIVLHKLHVNISNMSIPKVNQKM